jgi:hypothetical protein
LSIASIVTYVNAQGDKQVYPFLFSRSYTSGCDQHPDMAEHELIANELAPYLKKVMGW